MAWGLFFLDLQIPSTSFGGDGRKSIRQFAKLGNKLSFPFLPGVSSSTWLELSQNCEAFLEAAWRGRFIHHSEDLRLDGTDFSRVR